MFNDWLPFAIYALFALAIPTTMVTGRFVFAQRPHRFDIEIVFLYPLAVILHELSWFGFFEFLTFLVILLVAYVYIWRKGALEWR